MSYTESNGTFLTQDQRKIHSLIPKEILTQAFCGGISFGIVQGEWDLQYCAIVYHLKEYQMYWLPFDSEYIGFQILSRFIAEFYKRPEWEVVFMEMAAKWKLRQSRLGKDFFEYLRLSEEDWRVLDAWIGLHGAIARGEAIRGKEIQRIPNDLSQITHMPKLT